MEYLGLDEKNLALLNELGGYRSFAESYLMNDDVHASPLQGDKTWEQFILHTLDLFIEFDKKIRTEYSRDTVAALIDGYGNLAFELSLGLTAIKEKEKALMVLLRGKDTYMKMATKYDRELLELFEVLDVTKEQEEELKRKQIAKEDNSGKYFKIIFFIILIILAIKYL